MTFQSLKKEKSRESFVQRTHFKQIKMSLGEPGITCIPLPLPTVVLGSEFPELLGLQGTWHENPCFSPISGFTHGEKSPEG